MRVKELFYTVQGEGVNTGRSAVFCRFAGCNLWSGHEKDRSGAICQFCDTDFLGGVEIRECDLIAAIVGLWPHPIGSLKAGRPLAVLTGGEPGLQVSREFIDALRIFGFDVAIETNGTVSLPKGDYHITMSPKAGTVIKQRSGTELKVVWPQVGLDLDELLEMRFAHKLIQPMDGHPGSIDASLRVVQSDPRWRLSLQTHKYLGIK